MPVQQKVMTLNPSVAPNDLGHIGILMGGYSSERGISLKSGQAIAKALLEMGCQVETIDIQSSKKEEIVQQLESKKIDVAFIALHGVLGEDGVIQSILHERNIPYVGSNVQASQIAINKAKTQKLLKSVGVPVAEHCIFDSPQDVDISRILAIGLPVVVKPTLEGSSVGVSVVQEKEYLEVALTDAFRYGNAVLVERFIQGRELTCGILDQVALPLVEICSHQSFFDFTAKYQSGLTEYIVPAQLDPMVTEKIQQIALAVYRTIGCRHMARVDMILDQNHQPFVLEINTIPGFTATSLLPKAARAAGIDFNQLCIKLIELAYGEEK